MLFYGEENVKARGETGCLALAFAALFIDNQQLRPSGRFVTITTAGLLCCRAVGDEDVWLKKARISGSRAPR